VLDAEYLVDEIVRGAELPEEVEAGHDEDRNEGPGTE
jgi:hypothetical protein